MHSGDLVQVRDLTAMGPHVADRLLLDIANEPDQLGVTYEPQVWRTVLPSMLDALPAIRAVGALCLPEPDVHTDPWWSARVGNGTDQSD